MIPGSFVPSTTYFWSKNHAKDSYELRRNGDIVAYLHRVSRRSASFEAESQVGRWVFRRTGFWGSNTEIVDADSGQVITSFKANWTGGGTLIFADGELFHLHCRGMWHPVWSVLNDDGRALVHVDVCERKVEVVKESRINESRLALLVIFAWHRVQQAAEDAAEVAVMAAAS